MVSHNYLIDLKCQYIPEKCKGVRAMLEYCKIYSKLEMQCNDSLTMSKHFIAKHKSKHISWNHAEQLCQSHEGQLLSITRGIR